MSTWFQEFIEQRAAFKKQGLEMKDFPGVSYAHAKLNDALFAIAAGRRKKDRILDRVSSVIPNLMDLDDDSMLHAQAIVFGECKELLTKGNYLASIVSAWLYGEAASESYLTFFKDLFGRLAKGPVQNWKQEIERSLKVAEELDLGMSLVDIIVALVVVAAVTVSVYFLFFFKKRPEEDAAPEFAQIAKSFHGEGWAQILLQGNARDWTLDEAWNNAGLSREQKTRAIQALATLPFGQLVEPKKGDDFDSSRMLSDTRSGEFVWDCQNPGLRWKSELLERPIVEKATGDYLALLRSTEDGRALYIEEYETTHSRPPNPTDFLEDGVVEDVFHVLSGEVEVFDEWLESLIANCPDRSLAAACEENDKVYVEQRMVSTSSISIKAKAEVQKRLHRGLMRKGNTDDVVYAALVEASDSEVEDPYDQL